MGPRSFGRTVCERSLEFGMLQPPPGVSVDLTTEIRWFFDGRLPPDVRSWFTHDFVGLIERRCDTYRVDGRSDIGVKQRSRRTLELKLRTRPPEPVSIADNVHGRVETWRRWSPADALLCLDDNAVWVDVDKTVVKRRFNSDGLEQPLSQQCRAMTIGGCDAEVVALSANGQEAWSFAFAAFGQGNSARDSLTTTWRSLIEQHTRPNPLRLDALRSHGYPEWLTQVMLVPARSHVGVFEQDRLNH